MATTSVLRKKGKIVGYQTNLGKDQSTGKARRKFHKTWEEAQAFIKASESDDIGTGELYQRKEEMLSCLQRLTSVGASMYDATEFYLKHGVCNRNAKVGDVIAELIEDKKLTGRGAAHINDLTLKLGTFRKHVGERAKIGDITPEIVKNYIYVANSDLNQTSKANHIRLLSLLFNYSIEKKYVTINPVLSVDRPKKKFSAPKTLSPETFEILLNHCFKNKWFERVSVFVLVGFCGIRLEEASKLTWKDVDLRNRKVMVPDTIAKGASFRRNEIPENATSWLTACHDKRETGPIIGPNWKTLLRSAIHSAKIQYPKNCVRHSFCSYALEAGWPKEKVSSYMGHRGSPNMVDGHYRNLVEQKDALKWWSIVPNLPA